MLASILCLMCLVVLFFFFFPYTVFCPQDSRITFHRMKRAFFFKPIHSNHWSVLKCSIWWTPLDQFYAIQVRLVFHMHMVRDHLRHCCLTCFSSHYTSDLFSSDKFWLWRPLMEWIMVPNFDFISLMNCLLSFPVWLVWVLSTKFSSLFCFHASSCSIHDISMCSKYVIHVLSMYCSIFSSICIFSFLFPPFEKVR